MIIHMKDIPSIFFTAKDDYAYLKMLSVEERVQEVYL